MQAGEVGDGSARSALGYPVFRRVFVGAFLSNVGSWMQMVVLGALAYDLTNSSSFVGLMVFAQLGPMLALAMVGGLLADRLDRRRLLISITLSQGVAALVLAAIVVPDEPNKAAMLAVVCFMGMGQAVFAPTYSALLPQLVDRRDMAGAISLNSASMNTSRVIGPVLGALLDSLIGAPAVFVVNGLSYLFIIGALHGVELPANGTEAADKGLRALGDGLRAARRNPVIFQCLAVIFTLSLISLPFIGQFPVLAERNLGVDERSTTYGVLYACFGLGAVLGALSISTVFKHVPKLQIARSALAMFAGGLAVLALLRGPVPAFPVVTVVGFAYIALVTSLMTLIQETSEERTRGRVMALWVMGWGGMVPIGNLLAGPIIEWTSVTLVLLVGAGYAAALVVYLLRTRPAVQEHEPVALAAATATCPGR